MPLLKDPATVEMPNTSHPQNLTEDIQQTTALKQVPKRLTLQFFKGQIYLPFFIFRLKL